ncbi:murein hydrolase activator EnvC family protein [Aurantiacibacter sediminis]|uniref:Peptidoglycan DD-metalloendopeptidase family protein n=1 Tax=Aurantiacibacter sediminis TaxID=2793064 RepID=A0ABS0N076_9SPHN|nr:peptidoglycan DD-metalloendopeptidase family protein [Aurantiacibacter sediminis]MBH5321367.1 peptidoglycan DD-metalloendopeptidase family protein [Aurantiacibacter sediminis]
MAWLNHRLFLLGGSALLCAVAAVGQRAPALDDPDDTRAALAEALQERRAAEARSERLEAEAAEAEDAAERAAREAAAIAARIQQAEAGIAAARARMTMIVRERDDLREELGREQRPIVRLTAALQQFSRRPVAFSVLRPGDVSDVVHLRAMLHNAVPQVQQSTEGLRTQIARSAELSREAAAAAEALSADEAALAERRDELAEIESRERLAARAADSAADREAERALALAEEARDLDGLVDRLDRAAALRERLAALPGPQLRPASPASARVTDASGAASGSIPSASASAGAADAPPSPYILPVAGRTLTGFGAPQEAGLSQGLTLGPIAGAQVVAPANGRIAFAGPYRGYGQIVIIEHRGGWTSLITGLARSDVRVGQDVVGGAPLGVAGPDRPSVTLELRRNGEPVNPITFVS